MSELTARRREERDRRRSEIIDAAAAVIAETGFDALTMDAVARHARLSRALLYVYFEDRDALQLALAERALELLLARFALATRDAANGLARIEALGRTYVRFARELPVYFQALALREARVPQDQRAQWRCNELGMLCHGHLAEAIRLGLADGSVRADLGPPDAVAIALWGFMHGVIQIASTRGALLSQRNTDALHVYDQALALTRRALSTRAA